MLDELMGAVVVYAGTSTAVCAGIYPGTHMFVAEVYNFLINLIHHEVNTFILSILRLKAIVYGFTNPSMRRIIIESSPFIIVSW